MSPETHIEKALAGDYGAEVRRDAEAALTHAVDQGYDDDPERVAGTLNAMREERS